ncbi:MAG: PEGA domain-containing protein [Pyrinomonadaceae bacterium]
MLKREMTAIRSSFAARLAFAALIALACGLLQTSGVRAADKKPNFGRIEISTNPGGYPIMVDGQPAGETTVAARLLDLPPGRHTVEITMPNGARWVRDFNVVAGRKNCIVLNYKARAVAVTPKSPCPYPVNVSAPGSVNDGDIITFSADVSYGGASALNYTWTVSPPAARISRGAGTSTIDVDTTGLGKQRVTAILVVDDGSGERSCRQTAQASTDVLSPTPPPVEPRKFDEFVNLAFDDQKARLDNLAIQMQNEPNAQAYIIVYAGQTSRAGTADRLGARARDYLTGERGLDPSRITVVNGGFRESDYFELWIVPQGAQPPQPTPTVQPGDARPGAETGPRPRRSRRSRRR